MTVSIRRAFALVALVGLSAAVVPSVVPSPAVAQDAPGTTKRPQTPVLSARRFPATMLSSADAELATAIDGYLGRVVGSTCAIVEIDGRRVLARNADTALTPASTIKMVTALAALDILGPDTTLSTTFRSEARVEKGVLDGDLWVVGGGDPILTTKGYISVFDDPEQVSSDFAQLADRLQELGIRRITGSIIGDDSRYDAVRWVPSWPSRYQTGGTVSPLSALVVNDGSTGYSQSPDTPTTTRKSGDAPLLFVETLRTVLTQRGVEVEGATTTGVAPDAARELGSVESLPVIDLVSEMLLNSDNTTAELLTKEMGLVASGQGTTEAGLAAIRESLQRQGVDLGGVVMKDGSGLDTGNRANCTTLLALYERLAMVAELDAALPVGGRTGTLRRRMLSTPSMTRVRAKTGTLSGVNALVGTVDTTQGWDLTFSFLHLGSDIRTTGVADGFTDRLVGYGARQPKAAAISPSPAR